MNKIDNTIYNNLELLPLDLQGWNGSSGIFHDLVSKIRPITIIEVGSWKGLSAVTMGKAVKNLELNNTKIHCVDTWLGAVEFWGHLADTPERNLLLKNGYPQIYYQFLSNVLHSGLTDVIIPFPNTSSIAANYFKTINMRAQMIYIDASHEEQDVYNDMIAYFALLDNGGVIFGDDFNNWIGVQNAVKRFSNDAQIRYEVVENNFWVIYK